MIPWGWMGESDASSSMLNEALRAGDAVLPGVSTPVLLAVTKRCHPLVVVRSGTVVAIKWAAHPTPATIKQVVG